MRQNLLSLPRRAGLSGRVPVGVFIRSASTKAESGATGPTSSTNGSNGDGNGNGNALDSRWFSNFRHRVNKLGNAKLPADLAEKRSGLVRYVQDHWVDLLAGREGYITKKDWRGLDSHQVAWGEMVSK
jgi:hypothetical protein